VAELSDQEMKEKILEFLKDVPGKGVEVPARIISALGMERRPALKLMRELEQEGKIVTAGAAAGVIGYKLKQ
jgi:hypothetical protein